MFTRAFATLRMAKSAFAVTYTFMDFGAVFVLRLSLQIVCHPKCLYSTRNGSLRRWEVQAACSFFPHQLMI